jgi:hypothetical protein
MKYKKSLSLLILLLYIVSFTPFNSDIKKVRASENSGIYTYYNADKHHPTINMELREL